MQRMAACAMLHTMEWPSTSHPFVAGIYTGQTSTRSVNKSAIASLISLLSRIAHLL